MPSKTESIAQLAAYHAHKISANSGNYMAFLTTAAHNFKYNFRDQLLIYAQKPDATACAEIKFWNTHGRWVNQGTKGIALLVDTDRGYRLRHVFDMSDTNSREGRTVPIWQMKPQYEDAVIEALENSYGELTGKPDFAECLLETAKVIVEDNFNDYYADLCSVKEGSLLEELDDLSIKTWFRDLLEDSVAFMMLTRCGIDPRDYFSGEDFARIFHFNTPMTISILGDAVSDIAEMPLREIAGTVRDQYLEEQKQNRTFVQRSESRYNGDRTKLERSVEHGTDVQEVGRLPSAQPGGAGDPENRKIWDAAAQLPSEAQERLLHGDAAQRQAERLSGEDRPAGHRDGGAADGADGGGAGRDGGTESVRSDEVGGPDEQHPGVGGGSGAEGAGVRLTDPLATEEEQPQAIIDWTATGPTGLQLSHHDFHARSEIDYYYEDGEKSELLRTSDALKDHRKEIAAFFADHTDSRECGDFVKSFFNNTYVEKILSNGQRAGYRAWDDVLTLWRGAYLSREKEVFLRWGSVADAIYGMILLDQWLDPDERPIPSEAEQIAFIEQAEVEKASAFTLSQEAIDYIICYGSGVSEGKYRIYEQFQKQGGKEENIRFLKSEYGIGGHSDAIPGSGYWEDHDGKGITISRDYGDPDGKLLLTWTRVEKRIGELIAADRYLNRAEKEQYPAYREQREVIAARTRISEEFRSIIHDYKDFVTQLGAQDRTADRWHLVSCADAFSSGQKKMYARSTGGDFILPMMRGTMQTIIGENTHLTERCEAMLAELNGPLAVSLEPAYDELNPPPEPKKEYRFSLGDTVYLGTQEYEMLAFDEQTVRLYDPTFPLINKELPREEFDRLLAENPLNDHLLQVVEETAETPTPTSETVQNDTALETAKQLINEYCMEEFDQEADFTDLHHVDLAFSSTSDSEHTVEIYADLIDCRLANLDFDEMIAYAEEQYNTQREQNRQPQLEQDADDFSDIDPAAFRAALAESGIVDGQVVDPDRLAATPFVQQVMADVERIAANVPQLQEQEQAETEAELPSPPAPRRKAKVSPFVLHPEVPAADRHEYRITDDAIGVGTPGERFNNNVRAIRLLKKLESEGRFATPEEQAVLARYVGWGGLADCFDERHSKYAELKALLTEDEYAAARESTLTAFYTPPVVIRSIYQALENMGFKTGNLLEPSCAIGNFIGMRPESLADSKIYGIELDSISGRIAQQLYQKSSIAVQGFEKTDLPDSFFDAAIGNVPFGAFKVSDKRYDKHNFLIHDYFFARTLDKVRLGGVIAFITSKGTMDKENPSVRKYIAQRADLLGAIRLPNDTFKAAAGTEVTSDILFLQKRDALSSEEPAWVHLNTDENGLKMNQYFIDNPNMVMGEMREVSGPYGPETACLPREGQDLREQLAAAIQNIQGSVTEYTMDDPEAEGEDKSIPADPEVRNFSYTVVDGQMYCRENSRMNPAEVSVTAANRIKGLIGIRDCVRTLIEYQTDDWPAEDIQAEQKKLNALYDAFVDKYGRITSRANNSAFSMDSSYFLLSSLEVLDDERNFVRKADMFTKRTIKQKVVVASVDTASEALAVSLAERACVDLGYMASLMGGGEKIPQIVEDLRGVIFKDPASGPFDIDGDAVSWYKGWQTADEYLSGNVREKLTVAKLAAEKDPAFQGNVQALEQVQPVDLTASEISLCGWGPHGFPRKLWSNLCLSCWAHLTTVTEVSMSVTSRTPANGTLRANPMTDPTSRQTTPMAPPVSTAIGSWRKP